MHFALSLLAIAVVVIAWAAVCVRIEAWRSARAAAGPEAPRTAERRLRLPRQRVRPALPEGHRPPPGLGPLSPSERFLTQEATRGIRELQLFLVDQQAA